MTYYAIMKEKWLHTHTWDRYSTAVTVIVLLFFVGLFLFIYSVQKDWVTWSVAALFALITLLLFLWRPRQTLYELGKVTVFFPFNKKEIDLQNFTPIYLEEVEFAPSKAVRCFASGGLFSYCGSWRVFIPKLDKWVKVRSYLTNTKKGVLLLSPKLQGDKYILLNIDPNTPLF